jgi:competence protein ComEC
MKKLVLLLILPLLLLTSCKPPTGGSEPRLTVVFADVEKADFILIKFDDKFGVIDAGYKSGKDKIDAVMEKYGVTTLEFAAATHNDKDHIGGMAHVLEKYGAKTLYITPLEGEGKQYNNMLEAAAIKGTEVVKVKRGMSFTFGDATFKALAPDDDLLKLKDENEASVVLRMEYGKISVLFMGDALLKSEESIMTSCQSLIPCDVIKIGHHGGDDASSQTFLSKTKAKYAVISTGDERPAADVTLKAIEKYGMELYNTHTDGDITMNTNGDTITFNKGAKK